MSETAELPEHPEDCAYCARMARVNVEEAVTGSGTPEDPWVIHLDEAGSVS